MFDVSLELIATAGAVLAFLLAAAAGITSRRGIQLIVIGMLLSLLPHVSGVGRTWIAGQRGSHERSDARRVERTDRGPEIEALLRTMRAVDELTLALVALARREALEAGLGRNERMDLDGIRSTTEPVGVTIHAHGD